MRGEERLLEQLLAGTIRRDESEKTISQSTWPPTSMPPAATPLSAGSAAQSARTFRYNNYEKAKKMSIVLIFVCMLCRNKMIFCFRSLYPSSSGSTTLGWGVWTSLTTYRLKNCWLPTYCRFFSSLTFFVPLLYCTI